MASVELTLIFPEEYGVREVLRACVHCPISLERRFRECGSFLGTDETWSSFPRATEHSLVEEALSGHGTVWPDLCWRSALGKGQENSGGSSGSG